MYKKARSGEIINFTGITGKYEIPSNPDLVIDTENYSPHEDVMKIMQYLKSRKLILSAN